MSNHEDLQPDLQPLVAQLRAHRPEATALELDTIKQRVRTRVSQPARRRTRRAQLMKSRLMILSMLVLGMLLSTAGAGLAVSGLSASNNASVAEYGTPTPTPTPTPTTNTPPPSSNNTPPPSSNNTPPPSSNNVLGEQDQGSQNVLPENAPGGGAAPGSAVQPARQVETGASPSSGSQLPFTGFAAIPILLGGIALLTAGLVLRRRTAGKR